jgi:hypothetical protein
MSVVPKLATVLLEIYCDVEAHLDYTFSGLEDFVRTVYGEVEETQGAKDFAAILQAGQSAQILSAQIKVRPLVKFGGIRNQRVFDLLRLHDQRFPLAPELRNPLARSRLHIEQHYTLLINQHRHRHAP